MLVSMKPAWFMASYAMPPVMAPSPMTAMQWFFRFCEQQGQRQVKAAAGCTRRTVQLLVDSAITSCRASTCTRRHRLGVTRCTSVQGIITPRLREVTERTLKSRPTAMPRAAETEVELCPAPKGSYSLSSRLVKPAAKRSRRQRVIGTGQRMHAWRSKFQWRLHARWQSL